MIIKAPRGNRSQWHANFKLDEFASSTRDMPVVQVDETSGDLLIRGCLTLGPGHTLADVCKMLLTELQMAPRGAHAALHDPHCTAAPSHVGEREAQRRTDER